MAQLSRSIYGPPPSRLGYKERGPNLPKLGAEFSPGRRHLAALSAPVHVERSQRPVIAAWDRAGRQALPNRDHLRFPRLGRATTRREEDVHERASHEQIDERERIDLSNQLPHFRSDTWAKDKNDLSSGLSFCATKDYVIFRGRIIVADNYSSGILSKCSKYLIHLF